MTSWSVLYIYRNVRRFLKTLQYLIKKLCCIRQQPANALQYIYHHESSLGREQSANKRRGHTSTEIAFPRRRIHSASSAFFFSFKSAHRGHMYYIRRSFASRARAHESHYTYTHDCKVICLLGALLHIVYIGIYTYTSIYTCIRYSGELQALCHFYRSYLLRYIADA